MAVRTRFVPFLATLFATFFYLGYLPVAPGTWGTIGGVFLYLLLSGIGIVPYTIILVVLLVLGIGVSDYEEKRLGEKDASQIVIDEAVSFLITMYMIPCNFILIIIGFFFNRIFDITKPFPANSAQKLPGGVGIMVDDVISAVYSNIVLHVTIILTGLGG